MQPSKHTTHVLATGLPLHCQWRTVSLHFYTVQVTREQQRSEAGEPVALRLVSFPYLFKHCGNGKHNGGAWRLCEWNLPTRVHPFKVQRTMGFLLSGVEKWSSRSIPEHFHFHKKILHILQSLSPEVSPNLSPITNSWSAFMTLYDYSGPFFIQEFISPDHLCLTFTRHGLQIHPYCNLHQYFTLIYVWIIFWWADISCFAYSCLVIWI